MKKTLPIISFKIQIALFRVKNLLWFKFHRSLIKWNNQASMWFTLFDHWLGFSLNFIDILFGWQETEKIKKLCFAKIICLGFQFSYGCNSNEGPAIEGSSHHYEHLDIIKRFYSQWDLNDGSNFVLCTLLSIYF